MNHYYSISIEWTEKRTVQYETIFFDLGKLIRRIKAGSCGEYETFSSPTTANALSVSMIQNETVF